MSFFLSNRRFFKICTLLILFKTSPVSGQVYGCKDPTANNYNSSATVNDGTCTYNNTSYTPPVKVDPLSESLVENSGLIMAGNFLWSFNDGGHPAEIYRIDTSSNAVLQTVSIAGATNVDWEEMTFDGTYFYVGDFGNNANGARTDLKIYKFAYSAIPDDFVTNPTVTITAGNVEVLNFIYADQPQPPVSTGANNTKFDCEAMIIDSGKIHLFSKNWIDISTTHYVINGLAAGNYIASPIETLATTYLVTAASKSLNGVIALFGYQNSGTASHFMHLLSDYSGGNYFNGNKRKLNLPDATVMGQGEGIAFRNAIYGYISNEKFTRTIGPFTLTVNQKLRSFDIRQFISPDFLPVIYTFTGNGNWNTSSNWSNNNIPPSTINNVSEIIIDPVTGGQCVLNIPYTLAPGAGLRVKAGKNFVIQ